MYNKGTYVIMAFYLIENSERSLTFVRGFFYIKNYNKFSIIKL